MNTRKILRNVGLSKGDLKRLARRGGVKRMDPIVYDDARTALRTFLTQVIKNTITYTEYAERKTVTAVDVMYALKHQHMILYGGSKSSSTTG